MSTKDLNSIKFKISNAAPYFFLLYYIEIIYMMFLILLFFGKSAALITGITVSIVYACHIISLNFRRNRSRRVHLYMMDIHLAYSISFLINVLIIYDNLSIPDIILIITRSLLIIFEAAFIPVMTDENVIKTYI